MSLFDYLGGQIGLPTVHFHSLALNVGHPLGVMSLKTWSYTFLLLNVRGWSVINVFFFMEETTKVDDGVKDGLERMSFILKWSSTYGRVVKKRFLPPDVSRPNIMTKSHLGTWLHSHCVMGASQGSLGPLVALVAQVPRAAAGPIRKPPPRIKESWFGSI
jgi:hypothetical protein